MSWAAARRTTRVEDSAYCLLGLFDINIPLLYGEGEKAFRRLLEELLKVFHDQSILAANMHPNHHDGLLATSPAAFKNCNNLNTLAFLNHPQAHITVSSKGIQLPLYVVPYGGTVYKAYLECFLGESPTVNRIIYLRSILAPIEHTTTPNQSPLYVEIARPHSCSARPAYGDISRATNGQYLTVAITKHSPLREIMMPHATAYMTDFEVFSMVNSTNLEAVVFSKTSWGPRLKAFFFKPQENQETIKILGIHLSGNNW
jgi:hypothetical protein